MLRPQRLARALPPRRAAAMSTAPRPKLDFNDVQAAFKSRSTTELARAWIVFRLCTIKPLVKNARSLLGLSNKLLGKGLTSFVVRHSFFAHFCAGENEQDIQPTLARLRAAGVGGILDYAAEADVAHDAAPAAAAAPTQAPASATAGAAAGKAGFSTSTSPAAVFSPAVAKEEAELDGNLRVMTAAINAAKASGGFVAVKVTALAPPELLQSISSILHAQRRAWRRFNLAGLPNPYTSLSVTPEQFTRVLHGPRIRAADAADLFAAADYARDGLLDYTEWADFMALLTLGGEEARAAASQAISGADPALILSILAPGAGGGSGKGPGVAPPLSPQDQARLRAVLRRADELGAAAAAAGVVIMVDAEQTYLQPAIDAIALSMMRKYNRPGAGQWVPPENAHVLHMLAQRQAAPASVVAGISALPHWPFNDPAVTWAAQNVRTGVSGPPLPAGFGAAACTAGSYPVVYNTYQAYLTDTPSRLALGIARARREGFLFGAKLVRGAYMLQERARAKEMGYKDPIHPNLEATHGCYHECARALLDNVAGSGGQVMIASHNEGSIEAITTWMAERGIPASSTCGVSFGQLLGMCDHISLSLGAAGYNVSKYVPYGPIQEVLPYLIRRAEENSDVLGGVGKEIRLLQGELKRRLLG